MKSDESIRVIVVEDDPQMAALLRRGLTDEGYEVTTAEEGVRALADAQRLQPVIAVVDVMLPGMSGFELCEHLRVQNPSIRVLMLTARDDVDDRVRGLDAGADDYLTKPFAFKELAARLRALMRRDAAQPQTRFTAGAITLDLLDRAVTVGGTPVHLSPKEFALLGLLLRHVGEPVTRTTILVELWRTTEHIHSNIVDQYMRYLRDKLDRFDTGVSILTERGVGFKLSEIA